ncbi:hypothetical protein CsSME_00032463 [Camellia sinensis var. sinensis]
MAKLIRKRARWNRWSRILLTPGSSSIIFSLLSKTSSGTCRRTSPRGLPLNMSPTLRDSFLSERARGRGKLIIIEGRSPKVRQKSVDQATVRKAKLGMAMSTDHFGDNKRGKINRAMIGNTGQNEALVLFDLGRMCGDKDVGADNQIKQSELRKKFKLFNQTAFRPMTGNTTKFQRHLIKVTSRTIRYRKWIVLGRTLLNLK